MPNNSIVNSQASLIWNIADILRGGWKQHEYQDVILPMVVLKRLDSILVDTIELQLNRIWDYIWRWYPWVRDLETAKNG